MPGIKPKLIVFSNLVAITLIAQQMDYNTQIKNKPGVLSDTSIYTSFSTACAAALANNLVLSINRTWTSVPTTNCTNVLEFNGGKLQPANGQTVTFKVQSAPLSTICDISLGGHCIINTPDGMIYPQWWGASCAGNPSHDDAPGIQSAINNITSVPSTSIFNAGIVRTSGGCYISSTVTVVNKSMTIRGDGWGSSQNTNPPSGFWKSMPSLAGLPMLKVTNSQGTIIEGLRFIGSVNYAPSTAVTMDQQSGVVNESNLFRNLWIGQWGSFDSDPGQQFGTCIEFSGQNSNNGSNYGENVTLNGCGIGIDIQHGQYGMNQFHDVEIQNAGCGIKSGSRVKISQVSFAGNNADLCGTSGVGGDGNPQFELDYFSSENSVRLADFSAGGGSNGWLQLTNGYYLGQNLASDGKFITGITAATQRNWQGIFRNISIIAQWAATPLGTASAGSTSLTVSSGVGITTGMTVTGQGLAVGTTVVSGSGTSWILSTPTTGGMLFAQLFFYPVGSSPLTLDLSHNGTEAERVLICDYCLNLSHFNILWSSFGDNIANDFNFIDFKSDTETWRALGNAVFNSTHPDPNAFMMVNAVASHIVGNSGVLSSTCGAAAGSGATCGLDAYANDISGTILISSGTSIPTTGIIAIVHFAGAYTTAPHCTLTAGNAATAAIAPRWFPVPAVGTLTVTNQSGVAFGDSNNFVLYYQCSQ